MRWKDIQLFPNIHYHIDVSWNMLEDTLDRFIKMGLQLDPDFQRGHVWTEQQQVSYVEFALKIPQSGREIYLNHPGWMMSYKGDFVLVDGKQRLNAARRFINNEIPAFGTLCKDFEGRMPLDITFSINIAKLKTRADVLKWYLDFNAGGTPHTKQEIDRVRSLLEGDLGRRKILEGEKS